MNLVFNLMIASNLQSPWPPKVIATWAKGNFFDTTLCTSISYCTIFSFISPPCCRRRKTIVSRRRRKKGFHSFFSFQCSSSSGGRARRSNLAWCRTDDFSLRPLWDPCRTGTSGTSEVRIPTKQHWCHQPPHGWQMILSYLEAPKLTTVCYFLRGPNHI